MSWPTNVQSFGSNRTPLLTGVSLLDGQTTVPVAVDPTDGALLVSATISATGIATSANQTNGSQKTQIVDGSGNAVTVTGNKLDVNATVSLAGTALPIAGATTAVGVAIVDSSGNQISSFGGGTQYAEGTTTTPATGTVLLGRYLSSAPGTLTNGQLSAPLMDNFGQLKVVPVGTVTISGTVTANAGTNLNTSLLALETGGNLATIAGKDFATQTTLAALNTKVTTVNTGAVVISSSALPTGASTSAKQPALGTAGTASSDILTVQGIASMTALKVDGSGVTQPVSGTVTANAGTNLNTSALATSSNLTAGTQKTQIVDGSGNVIASTSNALNVISTQGTAASIAAGWPVIGGELADVTGTFTNATQTTSVTTSNFDGYSSVIVSINGTYGTATGVFEVSDDGGTTWYSVNAARSDGGAVEVGYTSLTNTNRMWVVNVAGADEFRVRSTAVASGTANIRISIESMPTPESASVTVYQLTASNLNATVVGTGTFATQATLAAETTKVIGTVNQGTNPWVIAGLTASGSSLTASPVTGGGLGKTSNPSAVSDGQVVNSLHDKLGKQVVVGSIRDLKANQQTTITVSTAETTIVTAIASTFNDLYGLILTNSSATATTVTIKDSTAGTTQAVILVPAGDTRGFMLPESAALKQTTVNTAWTATSSASITSLFVSALYVKNI